MEHCQTTSTRTLAAVAWSPGAVELWVDQRGSMAAADLTRIARMVLNVRAKRRRLLNPSLFSEPAWDILLELFAAEGEGRRLSVSSVGLIADIPVTTALRWINVLEKEALVTREDDPLDRRRSFLNITEEGYNAIGHCLAVLQAAVLSCVDTGKCRQPIFR
jgi:DNA-binding MarR family transcriptional regulator